MVLLKHLRKIILLFFIFSSLLGPHRSEGVTGKRSEPKNEEYKFEKKKLKISGVEITVEIADTPQKSSRGLMYRTNLADNEGMLFISEYEEIQSFWMKNTFVDLSIGFFDKNKRLIDIIQEMKAVKSEMETNLPTYQSRVPARYSLEVPKGWFDRKKIKLGSTFSLQ
ncbi:MAG: DUF192 domain-containing protein [Pseudobdellovibrionaceae bacterium]